MNLNTVLIVLLCLWYTILSAQNNRFVPFQDALLNPENVKSVQFFSQEELNQLDKFPNLEEVKASWANLDSLPVKLFANTNLTYLDLYENELHFISPLIGNLLKLTYLDLSTNEISKLPASLAKLKELKYLNLLNSHLSYFPPMITGFKKLEYLTISGEFTGVPDALFSMTTLKELNAPNIFSNTNLVKLSQLKNLEILALHLNSLKFFPPQICQLKKLKELYLYGNLISQLPREIGNLSELENLMMDNVKIIPKEIKNCKSLKRIMIQSTRFEKGSLENLLSVESLENVDLALCNISTLPDNISSLKQLKKLVLSNNKLVSLPGSFSQLDSLSTLELDMNLVTNFPAAVCELKNMRHLNLNENKIVEIPDCILDLGKLKILSISGASSFPTELLNRRINMTYNYDSLSPEMKEKVKQSR